MKKLLIATVILSTPFSAGAEVFNCNGVYQNQPCGADTKKTVSVSKTGPDEEKKALSKKRSLIHDLAMKAIKVNRAYKLNYDTSVVEDYCLQPEVSVIACNEKVAELSDRIDDRVESLEKIKAQKKANELNEAKLKQDEKPQVTIIRQPVYIYKRRPRHGKPSDPRSEINIEAGSRGGESAFKGELKGGQSVKGENLKLESEKSRASGTVSGKPKAQASGADIHQSN